MIEVHEFTKEQWDRFGGRDAHRAVFNEDMPEGMDRFDFALFATESESRKILGYLTARETDSKSLYLKHGGAFDSIKGSPVSLSVYVALIQNLKARYSNLTTLVENENVPYLRFAFKAGFRVIGVRTFEGAILLELYLKGDA